MGSFFDVAPRTKGRRTTRSRRGSFFGFDAVDVSKKSGDLTDRLDILEQQVRLAGGRGEEASAPGLPTRIIDFISRPNFAAAGAFEAFIQDEGLDGVLGRIGQELFSGIGSIEGEKEAFGEVFRQAGIGDLGRVSDVLPGLKDAFGGFFDFTGRGTFGLIADIAFDPLTFITGGTAGLLKISSKSGSLALSKRGVRRLGSEVRAGLPFKEGSLRFAAVPQDVFSEGLDSFIGAANAGIASKVDDAAKAAGLSAPARGRILEALRTGSDEAIDAFSDEMRIITDTFQQATLSSNTFSGLVEIARATEVDRLINANIRRSDPIFRSVQTAARIAAERRVAAAAATDPTLLAESGLRFMGRTIPGTPLAATVLSGASAKVVDAIGQTGVGAAALDATRHVKSALDSVVSVFSANFKTRNIAGYNFAKQMHTDAHAAMVANAHKSILDSSLSKLPRNSEAFERVTQAADFGPAAIAALKDPVERSAAADMVRILSEWDVREVALGLRKSEDIRRKAIPHYFENSPSEVRRVAAAMNPALSDSAVVGRHGEATVFSSLTEAVRRSRELHAVDGSIPVLRAVIDPVEILRRRGESLADAISLDSWHAQVTGMFGRELPFDEIDLKHFARPRLFPTDSVSIRELNRVSRLRLSGRVSPKLVKLLTDDGKRELLRREFISRVKTLDDLRAFNQEWAEFAEFFPSWGSKAGRVSADGTPYVPFTAGGVITEIPKSIADDLARMDAKALTSPDVGKLLRAYDGATNFFKRAVTIYFPAFTARNAYSNVAQSFLDIGLSAMNPVKHVRAARILAGADGGMVTALGETLTYDQIRDLMHIHGVRTTAGAITEQVEQSAGRTLSVNLANSPFAAGRRLAGKISSGVETEARALHFIELLERGHGSADAAARMKRFLFDYGSLTDQERSFFKRAIPFWIWTKKNVALQAEALVKTPGRVAAQVKPFRPTQEDNDQMVSWRGDKLRLRADVDGENIRMLTGIDLPINAVDVIWRGSVRKTLRQNLGMINPLIKAPIELGVGRNLFTGRGLKRQESAAIGRVVEQMPKSIQQWMGYRKEVDDAGRPTYSFDGERFYLLFQSFAWSRLVSTSDRAVRDAVDDDHLARALLNVSTGMRVEDLNLTVELERRVRERIRNLEQSLVRSGELNEFTVRSPARRVQQ